MPDPLIVVAGHAFSPFQAVVAGLVVGALALVVVAAQMLRAGRGRAEAAALAAEQARDLDARLAAMMRLQAEMTGRMQTMAEGFGSRQSDLARTVSERLDGLSHRLGHSMVDATRSTHDSLSKLHERIAVIDRAQATITELSGQVVQLQSILANKQTRGAFGQGRMEAIVADALPPGAFSFQATLSNGTRPDCLVHLPNGAPPLAIDAKFPLEAWSALEAAGSTEAGKSAGTLFRRDVLRHIMDIREKYLIPGETQDTAFLFVPSESIFSTLHERFDDLIQKAHRARVVVVSPSLLVLSIQVVQAVLRDHRMREQAHLIQAEVSQFLADLDLLNERVAKLQSHHGQAARDLEQIVVSTGKLARRGNRIENLGLGDLPAPGTGAGESDDVLMAVPLGRNRMAGE